MPFSKKNWTILQLLIITIAIIAIFTTIIVIPNHNNEVLRYRIYIPEEDIIRLIQIELEGAGFNFIVLENKDRLKATVTVDSTGGRVTAEIILINQESDQSIAFVDRGWYVFDDTMEHITNLLKRDFQQEYNVNVEFVFFSKQRFAETLEERDIYIEIIEQDLEWQIQEFIEQLQEK